MSEQKFMRILIITVLLGVLITITHAVYIYFAYPNSSIIQFIAREVWW